MAFLSRFSPCLFKRMALHLNRSTSRLVKRFLTWDSVFLNSLEVPTWTCCYLFRDQHHTTRNTKGSKFCISLVPLHFFAWFLYSTTEIKSICKMVSYTPSLPSVAVFLDQFNYRTCVDDCIFIVGSCIAAFTTCSCRSVVLSKKTQTGM